MRIAIALSFVFAVAIAGATWLNGPSSRERIEEMWRETCRGDSACMKQHAEETILKTSDLARRIHQPPD